MSRIAEIILRWRVLYGDQIVSGGTTPITSATQDGEIWTSAQAAALACQSVNAILSASAEALAFDGPRIAAVYPDFVKTASSALTKTDGRRFENTAPTDMWIPVSGRILRLTGLPAGAADVDVADGRIRWGSVPETDSRNTELGILGNMVGRKIVVVMPEGMASGTGISGTISYLRFQPDVTPASPGDDLLMNAAWDPKIIQMMTTLARSYGQ